MATAYIALGANLGRPDQQVRDALERLSQTEGIGLQSCSPLYRSAPLGPADQPDYCNAVCAVETVLTPEALLAELLAQERLAGRVRNGDRWGPRLLDLDLLHVEGVKRETLWLKLPHPEIARRNFVLVPLADIAPALEIPGLGRVDELARDIGRDGLAPWTS
ncbi:MAG: 2-amino-4-hydroxy-6-hydroxymethyldihydropteridine diphosphokinase [Nevskiaceae bacterium]|nr:MAG: 2-amino-4-hydroxy-6-hydroxymethyldihydropteridine diphosphokinase [Nevskiaceae bacterium]